MTTVDRFWSHVDSSGDCWLWTGARSPLGYGRFKAEGRPVQSHRYSWSLLNGIPTAGEVAHHCDNPPCVNPTHLFRATRTENERDKIAKGRHNPRGFRQITHCPQGHLYIKDFDGTNQPCRTCQRNRWRERHGATH